jgi:hypothetical protein
VKLSKNANSSSLQMLGLGIVVASVIVGCGGGSSDTPAPIAAAPPPPPAPTVLNGVVAVGAAVSGATIVVRDADSATPDVTTTSSINGSFSADVSALKAPFVVSASGVLNGEPVNIVAVVPTVSSNASNTTNVTTLTNAVAALLAPGGDVSALNVPANLSAAASPSKVADATALVVNTINTDPELAAALGANFNPLTTAFSANGTGIDSVLDKLEISVATTGVTINNATAAITASGAKPPAIVLTAAQTATPATVQALPLSVPSASLPTAAELAVLGKKYENCLALPIAQRVTLDAAGTVTAVSSTCNFVPPSWSSNGRTFAQEVGQFTLKRDLLTGAKAGAPTIAAVFSPLNLTASNEFKHAICNTTTCAEMVIPLTTASGQPVSTAWVIGKINGSWDFVGNRRPYRLFVEQRLSRKLAANTTPSTSYFLQDRFESSIRVIFDLSEGNVSDIRAVRWTGPGLPAAGLVTHRSQRCSTDDRMPITNQAGSLLVNNSTTSSQLWNNNGATEYILSAAKIDGSTLLRPVPSGNWSGTANPTDQDQAPTDQIAAIPAFALYKAEIFKFSNTTATPDEIVYTRTSTPYEPASAGASKAWPVLSSAFVSNYLTPTGSGAGVISSLAQTMNWTNPAGNYVTSGYLFSQNTLSAVNSEAETSNYRRRGRLDFLPSAYGDSSAMGLEFASIAAGTSLSPSTVSSGTNPNPRCTNPDLVELLATNASSYREAGLSFRGADRKSYSAITFWSY